MPGLGSDQARLVLRRIVEYFRQKGRVHLAELAVELGYRSPEYFRRSVWRLVEAKLGDCIVKVEPWVYEWVCNDSEDGSETV